MRRPRNARLLLTATGTVALWLAGHSVANASALAPVEPRMKHVVCHPQNTPAGGPMRTAFSRARRSLARRATLTGLMVRRHFQPRLHRYRPTPPQDTDAVPVQSTSTAAVDGEANQCFLAQLEPLGILALPQCQRPNDRTVSRRSPRGPPLSPNQVH
jgi:hypothetical protein